MIGRLAIRSLTAHPVRSAVLAAGFGVGVAVMAILLGVAEIILEQSRAPALIGGGDVLIRLAPEVPGRLVMSGALQNDSLRSQIETASPSHTAALSMIHHGREIPVDARGGIPSLERRVGDPETASVSAWQDTEEDITWTQDTPEEVLRHIDRFHSIPDTPAWSDSWAEWLYFNGRAGDARFYLTFLVGPATDDGRRSAGVRLQLNRGGLLETFAESHTITNAEAMLAPDLTLGASSVRLVGMQYRVHLDLPGQGGRRVRGDLTIEASAGRLVPPLEITGARGWLSGYVVPVMSGQLDGMLDVDGDIVSFAEGSGYHDHNWGFWEGVSWQWGQVQHGDLSILFGRVFPPSEAADPDRVPGFVGVVGPDGPLTYTDNVTITETNDARGQPRSLVVTARRGLDFEIEIAFDVESAITTEAGGSRLLADSLDFFQLNGTYSVMGHIGDQTLAFTAPGSAETFRGR
ncbi:MAG: hypothetical protein O2930_05850 [Acidobacteria bacterium]|nr:hypothetical protein [Acidobacteriota bacterium]